MVSCRAPNWFLVAALTVVPIAGCRIAPEPEPLGEPAAALGESGPDLASVDFTNAVYASACGLTWVDVGAGVGEGSGPGGAYGMEVVDFVVGDFDGAPGEEAAVLVDCLGGDTFSPHVLGFTSDDARSSDEGSVVLLPSTGGSLPAGHEPLAVRHLDGGALVAELSAIDGPVEHELGWAGHILDGGELAAAAGSVLHGVVVATEPGALILSLAPGVGYRIAVPDGFVTQDPDTGVALGPPAMVGRPARVTLDVASALAAAEILPAGAT